MKFIVTGVATQQQQPPHVVCPRQRCANSTSSSTAEDDDDVFLESGGATLPLLPASPGAAPFAVSTAHPSQSLYGSPGGGSLQRYGPTSVVAGDAASVGREARGSSSRRAPGRPPSLQSGQSFDENESLASGSGCGGVHVATTRRSVRSDDGILFVGGPGGSGFGGDTCSSVSAESSERLSAAASADRRPAGDECDLYEDDWESGYASGSFNPGQLLQQGARDAEVLKAWLGHLHFDGYSYADNFLQAGYDMPTVSRMTPEDLTAIGITVPEHRRKLTAWISQLKIHDGLPDYRPASVLEWLQLLHLEQYYGALKNECDSVAALTKITWEDLEEIGIKKLGHQKKIMLAVEQLKKIGKRQSCSSQSSSSSEPPAGASAAGLASATPQRQPSCRRFADAASCGGARAHHRSVSGEMVQSTEGFCAGQRPACRQLSCDSAMTRSLMLQQTFSSGVSRSNSGNTVTAATVSTGDYAQPRNLSFSRPDDSTSLNSSEDSASSAGSCSGSGHYSQPVTPARRAAAMANAPLPCGQAFDPPPMYPGAGGGWAAPDKRRHLSASSGGSGGGSIVGSSPPQYSTLARQAVVACGGRTGRGYRQASAEESPYARLPVRESTPPLAAGVAPGANHDSPFAGFPSPYSHIPNGVQANGLNASAKASMVSPPPSDGLVPSSRHSAQQSRLPPPHASSPFELTGNDRDASPPAMMSSVVGGDDDCEATSSSSDCELDGQEFPPMAPPIAFNMQHMRVPRQQRTIAQLPVVAERRPTTAAAASTAVAGRTPARDAASGSTGGAVGSEVGAIAPRRTYVGVGTSGQSAGASDSLAESCIGTIPFANENAGTIRQRPASSSSSTCSGGDGNCRLGDEWDGSGALSGASPASSGQAGRRSLRMPRDLVTNEGSIDDTRRFARPVMHVQPVVISDQRYSSPALPALSALQRHIFEEDGDAKKELLADAAECTRCSADLDAMLERDPDAS